MKRCPKCGVEKDETKDFHIVKSTGKPRHWCKVCTNADNVARAAADPAKYTAKTKDWRAAHPGRATEISRAWQLRNPEKVRSMARRRLYGIDFDSAWKAQEGRCALCGGKMHPTGHVSESVCVDHDRSCCPGKKSCGKCVRGLIHWSCNLMLGYAKDNPALLRSAAEYIERNARS